MLAESRRINGYENFTFCLINLTLKKTKFQKKSHTS